MNEVRPWFLPRGAPQRGAGVHLPPPVFTDVSEERRLCGNTGKPLTRTVILQPLRRVPLERSLAGPTTDETAFRPDLGGRLGPLPSLSRDNLTPAILPNWNRGEHTRVQGPDILSDVNEQRGGGDGRHGPHVHVGPPSGPGPGPGAGTGAVARIGHTVAYGRTAPDADGHAPRRAWPPGHGPERELEPAHGADGRAASTPGLWGLSGGPDADAHR